MVERVGPFLVVLCAPYPGGSVQSGCDCSKQVPRLSFSVAVGHAVPAHSSPALACMAGADLVEQREPEGFVSVHFLPARKSTGPFRCNP